MDLGKIVIIGLLLSPLIILALFGASLIKWENPITERTKYSVKYLSIISEQGTFNPFTVKTNLWYDIQITNRLEGIPIKILRFSFTIGMTTFMYTSSGNTTSVILDHNFHEIDLREQFRVLGKSGDTLSFEIQVISEFYETCMITIQGGVI